MKTRLLPFAAAVLAFVICGAPCACGKDAPIEQQIALAKAIAQYELPAQSVAASKTDNGQLVHAITVVYEIAVAQGLIADARLAAQGILIAGRQGKHGQMLVAIRFYQSDGKWVLTHVTSAKYYDQSACEKMSKKLLAAISGDDGKR